MNRLPEQDELLLTAFQYAAGELTAADAARFESRLADDLAAQQALADAVLLAGSLRRPTRVAAIRPATPAAQGRNRTVVAAVMAACAIGLIALAWPSPSDDRVAVNGHAPFGVSDQERARSLLAVWSEMSAGMTLESDYSADGSAGGRRRRNQRTAGGCCGRAAEAAGTRRRAVPAGEPPIRIDEET